MENWREKWEEVHRREVEKQIAQLAIEKAQKKKDWWAKKGK